MSAVDKFGNHQRKDETDTNLPGVLEAPADFANVTKSNSEDLPYVTRAVSIGTAGTLKVTNLAGNTVTLPANALAVGVQHIMRVTRIWADSTASEIVAWY